jgi:hypothetical protein
VKIIELRPSPEGRVEIKPGDPLYDAFRPSSEAMAKIEADLRTQARLAAELRHRILF